MARDNADSKIRVDNEEMRKAIRTAIRERGLSDYRASLQIGGDLSTFQEWLRGKALAYPKTARRIAKWLGVSSKIAATWEASARAYKAWVRWGDDHGSRSMTCAVIGCGVTRQVKLAQLNRKEGRKSQWTCSPSHRALLRIMPGPDGGVGPQAVFKEILKAGSVQAFARKSALSGETLHRLCRHPQHAPAKETLDKLTAVMGPSIRSLFQKHAGDRWNENLADFRAAHPKGSKAAKRVLGKRAGQARRKSRIEKGGFPKLSEAQRRTALHKMEEDPSYGQALRERLARGQRSWRWKAIRLLMVHLRLPDSQGRVVFRSFRNVAHDEVLTRQLREWALADEQRTGIPQAALLQFWMSRLGITPKGGRPSLTKRLELVEMLRKQRIPWGEIARQVSESAGREIEPDALQVWYHRTPLRQSSNGKGPRQRVAGS